MRPGVRAAHDHFLTSTMLSFAPASLLFLLHLNGVASKPVDQTAAVNTTTCNGQTYTYEALAGFGKFPSDARDKFGDTIGGIGSSVALEKGSWKQKKGNSEAYEVLLL